MNMSAPVSEDRFPPAVIAAENYRLELGSVLTSEANFGRNPFATDIERRACEAQFTRDTHPLTVLFNRATNGDYRPLQEAVVRLIDLAHSFAH